MNSDVESWRPLFGGKYEVLSHGRIRYGIKAPYIWRRGNILKQWENPKGYMRISLFVGGRSVDRPVHRYVADAFIGPRPSGYQVNHKDGVKKNNHCKNLEWVTPAENIRHANGIGLMDYGERHPRSQITDRQAVEIFNLQGRVHQIEIARIYGISPDCVYKIHKGLNWVSAIKRFVGTK